MGYRELLIAAVVTGGVLLVGYWLLSSLATLPAP